MDEDFEWTKPSYEEMVFWDTVEVLEAQCKYATLHLRKVGVSKTESVHIWYITVMTEDPYEGPMIDVMSSGSRVDLEEAREEAERAYLSLVDLMLDEAS